jgi:hypothetical protein
MYGNSKRLSVTLKVFLIMPENTIAFLYRVLQAQIGHCVFAFKKKIQMTLCY